MKLLKRSIITLLVASCVVSEAMCMEQKKGLIHNTDTITINAYDISYSASKDALKNSGTLSDMRDDMQKDNFDISYLCQKVNLSQKTFADVIMPALKDGENYTLSQNYSIKELLEITRAANYLNMPHLLRLASKKNAEYILKNIGKLDEKNSNLLNLLRTELPEEMRQQIADFFTPALCATIYNCATLSGHGTCYVMSVCFSPDGKTFASCSSDRTIKLWDVKSQTLLTTLTGHTSWVRSVVFSPDGKLLASCSEDRTVKLWDVESKKLLTTFWGHTGSVGSVAFSPDGKFLASCSLDNTINLWDVKSQTLLATLLGHKDAVNSVVFSPDSKLLASCSLDNTINLWDVESKKLLTTLSGHTNCVNSAVFSPNGKLLASCSINAINLWDLESKTLLATLSGHKYDIRSVAFSPNGKFLASCSSDKTIKLWDVESKELLATLSGHTDYVLSVVFSPDGKFLASCANDKTIRLWRIPDFSFEQKLLVLYVLQNARNEQQVYEPSHYLGSHDDLQKIYTTFDETQKQRLTVAIKEINKTKQL